MRALISVSDKTGIVEFATKLASKGVEILSTGGTARTLREAGLTVKDVSETTGFPEMLDGRVKTLHPKIHGGLLAVRDNPEHMKTIQEHGIGLIDLVVVNLYPFEATVAREGVTEDEAIENIDIGGPSMIRSAAKNFKSVAVVVDPRDYETVWSEISVSGETTLETRKRLARKAFTRTYQYDEAIEQGKKSDAAGSRLRQDSLLAGTGLFAEGNARGSHRGVEEDPGFNARWYPGFDRDGIQSCCLRPPNRSPPDLGALGREV